MDTTANTQSAKSDHVFISCAQAARLLGISTTTLRRWRATGRGPAYYQHDDKQVRYRRTDVDRYLERCRINPLPGGLDVPLPDGDPFGDPFGSPESADGQRDGEEPPEASADEEQNERERALRELSEVGCGGCRAGEHVLCANVTRGHLACGCAKRGHV